MEFLLNSEHVSEKFSEDHAFYLFYQELNYYDNANFLITGNYFLYIDRNISKYIQNYMG